MRALLLVVAAALAPSAAAQVPDVIELQQRRADKLAQPFLRVAPWHTDLASAQRDAAATGRHVLVHCTRSFRPCGTSIRCERDVLATPEFAAFAADVVLYCHVSAHVDATQDRQLAHWRGAGWPHHVVLDATGRVLGTHESWQDKSVAALRDLVAGARAFVQLEAETRRDEERARLRRLEAGLAIGALDLPAARELFASCGTLPPDAAARLAAAITDLEVMHVLRDVDRDDAAAVRGAGATFATMHRHGKRPAARNAARDFWGGILMHVEAAEKPNLELQREALTELERRFANERGYTEFLNERRAALQARTGER